MIINTLENNIDTSVLLNTETFNRNFPGKINDKDVYGYIYKITNKENGKIYIGKTKDINRRAREYINSATNKNLQKYKSFSKIISIEGLSKFIMEPIDFAYNKDDLVNMELDYIISYDTTNPSVGYNMKVESLLANTTAKQKVRVQYADELMRRSKLVCCINLKTKYILFSTGLKLFGTTIARDKDEVKAAAKRCATLDDYIIYYMSNADYMKQLKHILSLDEKKIRGNTVHPEIFVKYREYIIKYIINNENPEGFVVRFIHQSDDTECKYEYETDLVDLKEYCKKLIKVPVSNG